MFDWGGKCGIFFGSIVEVLEFWGLDEYVIFEYVEKIRK
jgi:hypothetical protein